MTDEERKILKPLLFELTPKDGSAVGNKNLRGQFKTVGKEQVNRDITDEEYWEIRNMLLAEENVALGRGKGGSIYRVKDVTDTEKISHADDQKTPKEKELYKPFQKYLENYWIKDYNIKDFVLYETANSGRGYARGKWKIPDFAIINVKKSLFTPKRDLQVITFEIKNATYSIDAVYETAAHQRFSHLSYLAIHKPPERTQSEYFDGIESECERFGIGLIVFEDPNSFDTFNVLVDARPQNPDMQEVDNFILETFSTDKQNQIRKLF